MPVGPGRYDDLATYVRVRSHADGVVVIVLGGNKGSGFSVQTSDLRLVSGLPALLRSVADDIERS